MKLPSFSEFRKWFSEKRVLRVFLVYALFNMAITLTWAVFQNRTSSDLNLKPVLPTATNWLLFGFSVAILPLSLGLEELGFRVLPDQLLSRLKVKIKEGYGFLVYLVTAALWAAAIHQLNIVEADLSGRLAYFGVQLFSGFYFAYAYVKRGFWATWLVHLMWDLFLVALNLIMMLLY